MQAIILKIILNCLVYMCDEFLEFMQLRNGVHSCYSRICCFRTTGLCFLVSFTFHGLENRESRNAYIVHFMAFYHEMVKSAYPSMMQYFTHDNIVTVHELSEYYCGRGRWQRSAK